MMQEKLETKALVDQESVVATFNAILGEKNVLSGERLKLRPPGYCPSSYDCGVLLLPENTADVSEICLEVQRLGLSLVPHGGMTGLVDGTHTDIGQVAVSFDRINTIVRIDSMQEIAVVGAGVTLSDLINAAAEFNLQPGVDLPSRGHCTLGGMAATNAGGIQAIRYGMMRDNILGMTVVLASGEILDLTNSLVKNNAGYDLKHLFIGSEGTLGLITQLVVKLHALPIRTETALIACPDIDDLLAVLMQTRKHFGDQLLSFEAMWPEYYAVTRGQLNMAGTLLDDTHGIYGIIETGQWNESQVDAGMLSEFLAKAVEAQTVTDGMIAQSETQRAKIWRVREDSEVAETIHHACLSYDIGLELLDIPDYIQLLKATLAADYPDMGVYVFGHLGDGNLHVMLGITQAQLEERSRFDELIYGLLSKFTGTTISAEHGIGLEKRQYLRMSRSSGALENMRHLKRAFDPENILNRGKIL